MDCFNQTGCGVNTPLIHKDEIVSKAVALLIRKIMYTGCMPLLNTVGLFSNILCILVLKEEKKDITRTLLLVLTVADIMMNMFGLYNCIVHIAIYYYPRDFQAYYVKSGAGFTLTYAWVRSVDNWVTTIIAIQRTIAVTFPLFLRTHCRVRFMWSMIAVIVFLSGFFHIPGLFSHDYRTRSTGNDTSEVYRILGPLGKMTELHELYTIFTEVIVTVVPLILTAISSTIIIYQLRRHRAHTETITEINKLRRIEQSRVITTTLTTIAITFVICLTPFCLIRILKILLTGGTEFPSNLFSILSISTYFVESVNPCINLYIYIICSARYRESFLNLWRSSSQKSKGKFGSGSGQSTETTGKSSSINEIRDVY